MLTSVLNYISRHWRGEFSLGEAFWINTILISIIVWTIRALTTAWILDVFPSSEVLELGNLSTGFAFRTILIMTPIVVWQLVGLGRTNRRYLSAKRSTHQAPIWELVILVFLFAAWVKWVTDFFYYLVRSQGI